MTIIAAGVKKECSEKTHLLIAAKCMYVNQNKKFMSFDFFSKAFFGFFSTKSDVSLFRPDLFLILTEVLNYVAWPI